MSKILTAVVGVAVVCAWGAAFVAVWSIPATLLEKAAITSLMVAVVWMLAVPMSRER